MAHFEDETPYTYSRRGARPNRVNAGWLERGAAYRIGLIERDALDRLAALCVNWNVSDIHRFFFITEQSLGFHHCSLCPDSIGAGRWRVVVDGNSATKGRVDDSSTYLGSRVHTISAPDREYGVPDLVLHHVLDHHYLPPNPLIDAILDHPETLAGHDWCLIHDPWIGESVSLTRRSSDYPDIGEVAIDEGVRMLQSHGRDVAIDAYLRVRRCDRAIAEREVDRFESEQARLREISEAQLIETKGGLSDRPCGWLDCPQFALKGMSVCARHALGATRLTP